MAPTVDVFSANPGADIERSACVTVAIRPGAAYECGDLRLSYSLPAIRVFNQTRTATLLYSSQHARPTPIVRAWVTRQVDSWQPNYVRAKLWVNGVQRDSNSWLATGWAAGERRQVALSFDATNLPTNLYTYTLEIVFDYGDRVETITRTGELAIVNRSTSEFGPGWWVAGYESIKSVPNPTQTDDMYWVGGDGSTRKYVFQYEALNAWWVYYARTLTGVDSLIYTRDGYWRRPLSHGAYVKFDASGRHVATVNSVGHVTNFLTYFGCNRLVHIQLPLPAGYPGYLAYTFNYDKDATPTPCVGQARHYNSGVSETPNDTWRTVTRTIGTNSGAFSFAGDSSGYTEANGRIASWTDSRGTRTNFHYVPGGLLSSAHTPTGTPGDSVKQIFYAGEAAALVGPKLEADVFTAIYNPRWPVVTAFTKVWLGQWGNPVTVTDPAGRTTSILPDSTFPLLAARVTNPAGWSQYAMYNAHGKLTYMNADPVGGTGTPEWYYRYTDAAHPDNLMSTTDPAGITTTYEYAGPVFNTYPMLSAQQTGPNPAARVSFTYCSSSEPQCVGLPKATLSAADALGQRSADSLTYDALGNLARTLSHDGKCTEFVNDGIGRVRQTRVRFSGSCRAPGGGDPPPPPPNCPPMCQVSASGSAPGWVTMHTTYDALDRVSATTTTSPGDGITPEQHLQTRTTYAGTSDLPTRIRRWSEPDSAVGILSDSMRYDALGRVTWKLAQGTLYPETYAYDAAGNLTTRVTARGATLTHGYDAMNRLAYRVTPAVTYPAETLGTALLTQSDTTLTPAFPRLPLGTAPRTIDRDSASFTYDVATGQLWTANNKDARVTRTYFPNGSLHTETQSLRNVADQSFGQHVYTLTYGYDVAGRRTSLTHPVPVAPHPGIETWTYHPSTGLPTAVQPPLGGPITFEFDPAGQLSVQTAPSAIRREFYYTPDGELSSDVLRNGATNAARPISLNNSVARSALLTHDLRGKLTHLTNSTGYLEQIRTAFSPMGHLRTSTYSTNYITIFGNVGGYASNDSTMADALGNARSGSARTTENVRGSFGVWDYGGTSSQTQFTSFQYRTDSTGQLSHSSVGPTYSYSVHDTAGNVTQQRTPGRIASAGSTAVPRSERVMYYDAGNRLTAVDARKGPVPGADAFASADFLLSFDSYRYDALGRRVWIQSSRHCPTSPPPTYWVDCALGFVQRVVWDGTRELYEIKMPNTATFWEHDIPPADTIGVARQPNGGEQYDRSPHYGRVGYVYGGAIDRPLVVMRMGYGDNHPANFPNRKGYKPFADFPLYPQWDVRGEPALGTTSDGGLWPCEGTGAAQRCTYPLAWSGLWSPNSMATGKFHLAWVGSQVEDKRDATGLLYRRNRYLDASNGRFTQPDPIGLGGGLNSYGYASGDPVNFSDPFGLLQCPPLCDHTNPSQDRFVRTSDGRVAATAAGLMIAATLGPVAGRAAFIALTRSGAAAPISVAAAGGGGLTGRVVEALENSAPSITSRISAVSGVIPNGFTIRMITDAETGVVTLTGGTGNGLRQIILNPNGTSIVKAFDATARVFTVVKEIVPP